MYASFNILFLTSISDLSHLHKTHQKTNFRKLRLILSGYHIKRGKRRQTDSGDNDYIIYIICQGINNIRNYISYMQQETSLDS